MRKFLCLSAVALASWAAERPDLNGSWLLDPGHTQMNGEKPKELNLSIRQQEDNIHITETATDASGRQKKTEFECNTMGKLCKVNDAGEDAELTVYYNGAMLVALETRRNNAVAIKKRLTESADGKTLTMEVIHIAPQGKTESYTFTKQ
jgi:hypothetical protein